MRAGVGQFVRTSRPCSWAGHLDSPTITSPSVFTVHGNVRLGCWDELCSPLPHWTLPNGPRPMTGRGSSDVRQVRIQEAKWLHCFLLVVPVSCGCHAAQFEVLEIPSAGTRCLGAELTCAELSSDASHVYSPRLCRPIRALCSAFKHLGCPNLPTAYSSILSLDEIHAQLVVPALACHPAALGVHFRPPDWIVPPRICSEQVAFPFNVYLIQVMPLGLEIQNAISQLTDNRCKSDGSVRSETGIGGSAVAHMAGPKIPN